MALSSPMRLTSSASFSPSIRINLRLKIHQAQAKNFCRVLDIRVTQIMESDWTQTVFAQDVAEVSAYVIWINKIPHIIYTDVLQIFFTIASTALLALLFLTGFRCNQCGFNRRYQRQCTEAGIVLCPFFGDISTAFPSTLTHSNVCEMVMVLFTKSMADHFSPTTSLRRRP